ncbi:hypothetical protein Gohar_027826 [Gossypium harknessii]|uniref:Exo_endo_phos domain-containing protein n=1 Tax=Gossypium harknessii TaxID=34285 RepID=A0A7J9I8G7_9ROSI|nr:hypothetical protein [Gossypium harknessii]
MALGVEVADMEWDLSLRAQSRRALTMNSVWLREEKEGDWGRNHEGIQVLGYSVRGLRRNMGKNTTTNVGELPWMVCGDFNEILYGFKKRGDLPREEGRIEAFRKALEDCELRDMGFSRS